MKRWKHSCYAMKNSREENEFIHLLSPQPIGYLFYHTHTKSRLYRVPVQTAFLSWRAEDSNSPTPPQRGAKWFAVLCENCCHNVKIAKWGGILPRNGV